MSKKVGVEHPTSSPPKLASFGVNAKAHTFFQCMTWMINVVGNLAVMIGKDRQNAKWAQTLLRNGVKHNP